MPLNTKNDRPPHLILRLTVQTIVWGAIMAGLLFAAAGTWRWPQAWAFLAIFVACGAVMGAWLIKRDPGLLSARLSAFGQKGQPLWDRIFLLFVVFGWCAWLLFMGLDAGRWHTSSMPAGLNIVGGVLMIVGFLAVLPVFAANSFAAPIVRVQEERHQRVIDTGPYAIVRHPMYAVAILYLVGLPLLLGSWRGFAGTIAIMFAMAWRATREERTLARELPGYAEYMTRVRYRLIPGLW